MTGRTLIRTLSLGRFSVYTIFYGNIDMDL